MPKVDIDYSNTLFYKIYCKDTSVSDVYIGHTTNFVQRKSGHKQSCNNSKAANHDCKLYKFIRDNGGWDNWHMDIIVYHECNDHYEARKKEQEFFILHNATLNSIEPMPRPKPPREHVNDLNPIKSMHTCDVCKFSCFNTLDVFTQHLSRNKHIQAANRAATAGNDSISPTFICEKCDYKCSKRSEFNKHISTNIHKVLHTPTTDVTQKVYVCDYNNSFEEPSTNNTPPSQVDMSLVLELLKQNQEFKDLLIEQNKHILELVNKCAHYITTVTQ